MCQGVESLPVVLDLGGDVFILQDHPCPASLSPLCRGSSSISDRPLDPSRGILRTPVQASARHHLRVHPKTDRCSQTLPEEGRRSSQHRGTLIPKSGSHPNKLHDRHRNNVTSTAHLFLVGGHIGKKSMLIK